MDTWTVNTTVEAASASPLARVVSEGAAYLTSHLSVIPIILALLLSGAFAGYKVQRARRPWLYMFPVANKTKEDYFVNGPRIALEGLKRWGGKPFRVITGLSDGVIILGNKYTDEIKNSSKFESQGFLKQYWLAHLPGFDAYMALGSHLTHDVVRKHLTNNSMSKLAEPLSSETEAALHDLFGKNTEDWDEVPLYETVRELTARVSSRIFLGPELCRDPDWLYITVHYSRIATDAGRAMRFWPPWTHKYVTWFVPECIKLRKTLRDAQKAIAPILAARRAQKNSGNRFNDALQWFEDEAKRAGITYDPASHQLGLSLAAILTTSDLLTQTLFDLCEYPQHADALRDEIRSVVGQGGWKLSSLYQLRLLDSFLKESLRRKPVATMSLGRFVAEDVRFKDGTMIPKGTGIVVSNDRMWSEEAYDHPLDFDPYRFVRMREEAEKKGTQADAYALLAATSPEHLGFGLGIHSCPGRFHGANSSKLLFAHFIMRYDIKLVKGPRAEPIRFGFSQLANNTAKVLVKRRTEDVSFML